MRSLPAPIRDLELRDRLGELLGEALHDQGRAAPLYLIRSFGRLAEARGPVGVSPEDLIRAAEDALREAGRPASAKEVIHELLGSGLLEQTGDGAGSLRVAPGKHLLAELSAVVVRTDAYCRALEALYRRPLHPAGEMERALEAAACLFNEGLFFEVHEVLEALWLKLEGQSRLLLQGLIQIAVGFHHLENRNINGALSLLREGREKVNAYGPDRFGLRLDRFLEQADACRRSIESLGREAFDRFDRQMIPRMHFQNRGEA